MNLEWDEAKRDWTLRERGLDFKDAQRVFEAVDMELIDDRIDYNEVRIISFGQLDDRPVAVVWTQRNPDTRRIISMRHVHEREIEARRRAMDTWTNPLGRPRSENPKKQVTLRLDPDVIEKFRATGKGWQSRINAELRKALGI
jgi:uncharacterized protein (DUF4415 family)